MWLLMFWLLSISIVLQALAGPNCCAWGVGGECFLNKKHPFRMVSGDSQCFWLLDISIIYLKSGTSTWQAKLGHGTSIVSSIEALNKM